LARWLILPSPRPARHPPFIPDRSPAQHPFPPRPHSSFLHRTAHHRPKTTSTFLYSSESLTCRACLSASSPTSVVRIRMHGDATTTHAHLFLASWERLRTPRPAFKREARTRHYSPAASSLGFLPRSRA
jgi:hypothetical protein